MSSSTISAKIIAGLASAIAATGSGSSELVYLVTKANIGGDTPLSPSVITESTTLLPNAIFKSYMASELVGNIVIGDKVLVSDNTVAIAVGAIIRQGTTDYVVVSVDIKAPTSDVLAYISQVRKL